MPSAVLITQSTLVQLTTAVQQHYGESVIRARVAEYVLRFIRIAAAYEEIVLQKNTTIGFSMQPFSETGVSTAMVGLGIPQGFGGSLGSGMVFADEGVGRSRELSANAARIEGWRLTKSYEYWQQVRNPRHNDFTLLPTQHRRTSNSGWKQGASRGWMYYTRYPV